MKSNPSRRNFGFGRRLEYAGSQALKLSAKRSGGRYSWLDTNLKRWRKFCDFASMKGIYDARDLNHKLIERYQECINEYSVSTQQNHISSINVVMNLLSGGSWENVSPRALVGQSRSVVRSIPVAFEEKDVWAASHALMNLGLSRLCFVPLFGFYMGLRRREIGLIDIKLALRQAKSNGLIDIRRGTKGGRGRKMKRLIPVNGSVISVLESSEKIISGETRNLIAHGDSYREFSADVSNYVLPELKRHGISRLHDLRVAYACRRYTQLTGSDAPCNLKSYNDFDIRGDDSVRLTISHELGHGRSDIASAYIGGKPRYKRGAYCED